MGDPKVQFNTRVPKATRKHVERRALDEGWDNGLQVLAGLILFECLSEDDRKAFIRIATRVGRAADGWERFLAGQVAIESGVLNRKSVKSLIGTLDEAIERERELRRPA